jgi:hypothetical protein
MVQYEGGKCLYSRAFAGDFFKPKGEMTMPYALSEFVFCLWCLPVTVFIALPLAMLAVWGVKKLIVRPNLPA